MSRILNDTIFQWSWVTFQGYSEVIFLLCGIMQSNATLIENTAQNYKSALKWTLISRLWPTFVLCHISRKGSHLWPQLRYFSPGNNVATSRCVLDTAKFLSLSTFILLFSDQAPNSLRYGPKRKLRGIPYTAACQ